MPSTQFLAVVAFVLAAGTPTWMPPIAFQGGGDACALLTTAQVTAALGTTVEAGKPVIASSPKLCGWAPPGGPHIDGKKLTVGLITKESFDRAKTPLEGIEKVPVSGIGDDAVYITTAGFGTALDVKKAGAGFTVRVGGFKKDQEKEIEKALALQILKKM